MVKIQQYFDEISKDFKCIGKTDLNTEREEFKEIIDRLYANIGLIKDEVYSREGIFKPVCECLNCHKNGLAYEASNYKKQETTCEFCGTKQKVKLFKKGSIEIERLD